MRQQLEPPEPPLPAALAPEPPSPADEPPLLATAPLTVKAPPVGGVLSLLSVSVAATLIVLMLAVWDMKYERLKAKHQR